MSIFKTDKREEEVLKNVQLYGGFSVFWITWTQTRARAAMRLEERGEIVRKRGKGFGQYPWCGYRLGKVKK